MKETNFENFLKAMKHLAAGACVNYNSTAHGSIIFKIVEGEVNYRIDDEWRRWYGDIPYRDSSHLPYTVAADPESEFLDDEK